MNNGDGDDSAHSSGGDGDLPVGSTPAAVQATGQTTCYAEEGALIDCAGTGQDGDYQNGVPVPSPRYTDLSDGTVRDNHTGLIWLKDAECLGKTNWEEGEGPRRRLSFQGVEARAVLDLHD